jgi:glutathione S-transferase
MADFTLVIGNKNYSSWSLRGWLMARIAGIGSRWRSANT